MNQTFSLSRFWKLVRLQWSLNGINFIIGFLLLTFLFSFVLATYQFTEKPSGKFGNGLYFLLYFVFGVVTLITIVPWLKNKMMAGFYLTLPNSIFEKYLFYFLTPFAIYVLISPFWMYIIYLLKVFFKQFIYGKSLSANYILSFSEVLGLGNEYMSPKLVIAIMLIFYSFMIPFKISLLSRSIIYWLIAVFMMFSVIPKILDMYRVDFSISESMLLVLPIELYVFVFCGLSLLAGYFLLKEKEV
ncbi:MAG: hypothetical protein KA341_00545 [Saprospiraceae bacterium]|nr:hypothetical protein [Saprospiraceae bacterium]